MKSIRAIIVAAIFIFILPSAQAQVRNADSLIHKIFATLQAKDQKAFVALYPNAQQFGRFMRDMMEQTMKSEEVRKLMEADEKSKNLNLDSLIDAQTALFSSPEMFSQMENAFGALFQKTIEKGEKKGVRWSEAKLTGYTIDSSASMEEGIPFQPKGVKEAKGVIDFAVGNDAYQLAFNKVMYIESEGGWFGAEFPQLARKGENLAPDTESNEDETALPAPKKQTPATKGKAPAAKKSNATKAPARKKA